MVVTTSMTTKTTRENNHRSTNTCYGVENHLHVRVAPRNLDTGSVPWDPGKHVWAHTVPHQARKQEEDESQLEWNQEDHVLVVEDQIDIHERRREERGTRSRS